MRVRVAVPAREAKRVREKLKDYITKIEREAWVGDLELVSFGVAFKLVFQTSCLLKFS